MPRILETSERASQDFLKTRWYRNSYDQVKNAITKVISKLGYTVLSSDDHFGEIAVKSSGFQATIKIYQMNARETSVDLFIECLAFFEFGKNKNQIELIYNELNKVVDLKGLALHP